MADIRRLVDYALRQHMTVILNAQTEISMGFASNENLPTRATYACWRYLAQYYGHNPHVVFDLFNEPRFCDWQQWHAAFQPLVIYPRNIGAENQLWVEGLWWGATLAGVPLLNGQGIVYSFHHPGSPWPWQTPVGSDSNAPSDPGHRQVHDGGGRARQPGHRGGLRVRERVAVPGRAGRTHMPHNASCSRNA
jgi:hypothetical protein